MKHSDSDSTGQENCSLRIILRAADAVQSGDVDGKNTGEKLYYQHPLSEVQDICIKCIKMQWLL